ncbi:MAG: 2-hydroxychromene-2-carboxylate isomerase [Sneathiella sp.]
MTNVIEFYFEFNSPFAYIAAHQIEEVAKKHGMEVSWRPISLGHVWKAIGATNVGPAGNPVKLKYQGKDSARFAKLAGLPLNRPAMHPVDAKLARLAFYRLSAKDPALGKSFVKGVFDQFWGRGEDITTADQLAGVMKNLGQDESELEASLSDNEAKTAMIAFTQEAIDSGAFGMPWFKVGDEVFWGADRIPHIDQYLASKTG